MLQEYVKELRKTQLLTAAEEADLWQQVAEGSYEARQRLLTAYQPLVFKIAMSFHLDEGETMELLQEGMLGLVEAADHYDYRRGVAFSLYASHRIRGCMVDYLKANTQDVLYLDSDVGNGFTLKDTLESPIGSPVQLAEEKLLQQEVAKAMDRLPSREQQILTGLLVEERPAQEMALAFNISLGHVYRLQKQGLRRIRGMLARFIHDCKN